MIKRNLRRYEAAGGDRTECMSEKPTMPLIQGSSPQISSAAAAAPPSASVAAAAAWASAAASGFAGRTHAEMEKAWPRRRRLTAIGPESQSEKELTYSDL